MNKYTGNIPGRFAWAADLLDLNPSDNILEIGCGAGILAEQIAARLPNGKLLAIDQSVSMLKKAERRNKTFIEHGISTFLAADFLHSNLPVSYFDKIVAFNVNFFWKDAVNQLKKIHQVIKPGGLLFVFYQAPFAINLSTAKPIQQQLTGNSFHIINTQLKELSPTAALCIIAKPKTK